MSLKRDHVTVEFSLLRYSQILAVKRKVGENITSVDLNGKTITSLQINKPPGRFN